jgi:alkylated DNA repair protein (DNA oxidative demethylase)
LLPFLRDQHVMTPGTLPLGFDPPDSDPAPVQLGPHATLLQGFARSGAAILLAAIDDVCRVAPLRHTVTPGGWTMSVAMSNCGPLGWVSDRGGYRYAAIDPMSQQPWPAMPAVFRRLATDAAAAAGFAGFSPDACLINQYKPGARLTLHQDRNERDFSAPIVSVSLGLPAVFLWGGRERSHRYVKVPLLHGDVAVWGGADRLTFHGIATLADGVHPMTGDVRYNLTFRKAG